MKPNYLNNMYSKTLKNFETCNIKLLRSINDIFVAYGGVSVAIDFDMLDKCNIEKGEICQLSKMFMTYRVGYFNSRGSGSCYYSTTDKYKFVEGVDFVFV